MKPEDNKLTLDTSTVIKWFDKKEENAEKANEIMYLAHTSKIKLYQPELAKYEFGNVLYKGKNFPQDKVLKALETYYLTPINFVKENIHTYETTARIQQCLDITYYDASFLAAAKLTNSTLITANPKHQKPFEDIKVIKLSDLTF